MIIDCGTSQEVLSVTDTGEDILILKPLFIIGTGPTYTESKSAAITSTAARELAAILTHFADTGELPNDGEGSHDDN